MEDLSAYFHYRKGMFAAGAHRWAESAEELQRALSLGLASEHEPGARGALGTALSHTDPKMAVVELRAALELHAESTEGYWAATLWYHLGDALSRCERWDESATELEAATRIIPHFHSAHQLLGYVYHRMRSYLQAADHYRTAAELAPNDRYSRLG